MGAAARRDLERPVLRQLSDIYGLHHYRGRQAGHDVSVTPSPPFVFGLQRLLSPLAAQYYSLLTVLPLWRCLAADPGKCNCKDNSTACCNDGKGGFTYVMVVPGEM